jgi:hypothetical protein
VPPRRTLGFVALASVPLAGRHAGRLHPGPDWREPPVWCASISCRLECFRLALRAPARDAKWWLVHRWSCRVSASGAGSRHWCQPVAAGIFVRRAARGACLWGAASAAPEALSTCSDVHCPRTRLVAGAGQSGRRLADRLVARRRLGLGTPNWQVTAPTSETWAAKPAADSDRLAPHTARGRRHQVTIAHPTEGTWQYLVDGSPEDIGVSAATRGTRASA